MRKDNHYFAWGLTAVCVVCAIMLIYDVIFRDSIVMAYAAQLMGILAPILYGCAIAYLLAPVVNWFERAIRRLAGEKGQIRGLRAISMVLTWLVVIVLLYALVSVLWPELYKSVVQLFSNVTNYYKTVEGWVLHLLENNPELARQVENAFSEYYEDAQQYIRGLFDQDPLVWLKNNVLPQLQTAVQAVTGSVVGLVMFCKNLLVGIIVSLYLLAGKEWFAASGCKLCYTLLSEERAAWFIRGVKATDRIFSGFVRGKLLDSLIIGILCFIFSSLFRFPYAPLISVIIGATNIIPFFGPFLGAIPSAFLILLADPIKCLYFIIFVLVLQQFDGNILGPKILGNSTGISGFWVMVAILVGGGLWGVAGMFLGVPICACAYAGVRAFSAYRLKRKGLPVPSASYATHRPVWPEDPPVPAEEEPEEPQQ